MGVASYLQSTILNVGRQHSRRWCRLGWLWSAGVCARRGGCVKAAQVVRTCVRRALKHLIRLFFLFLSQQPRLTNDVPGVLEPNAALGKQLLSRLCVVDRNGLKRTEDAVHCSGISVVCRAPIGARIELNLPYTQFQRGRG